MGNSVGCVFREFDDQLIEPTPKVISFWEDSKNSVVRAKLQDSNSGIRNTTNQDHVALLPLLLGAQSNSKLHESTFVLPSFGSVKQMDNSPVHVCNTFGSAQRVPNNGRIPMSSPRLNPQQGIDVLARLKAGNRRFLAALPAEEHNEAKHVKPIVSILCCTPPPVPLDVIFGIDSREIACMASASLNTCMADDCGAAAVELSLVEHKDVPLILVMEAIGTNDTDNDARMRVWASIERLLANSKSLRASVRDGASLNAALLESGSGQIRFLGEHVNQTDLIAGTPRFGYQESPAFFIENEFVNREMLPIVPAQEALALLQFGNLRASSKPQKKVENMGCCTPRRGDEDDEDTPGHNPCAVILTSFDPVRGEGPPVEVLFDLHPSEVCAISTRPIPNDGSEETYGECTPEEQWRAHIHLAENVLATKAPRLFIVLGRAAVDASRDEAQAAKDSVFNDMWKLLNISTVIKAGVADGQLEVVGGIYHGDGDVEMPPGQIEWLGGHPSQESAVSKMARLYPPSGVLSAQDLPEQQLPSPTPRGTVNQLLENFVAGNTRFLHRKGQARSDWTAHQLATLQSTSSAPKTLVLCGASRLERAPERLLDARPGELLVHRTCGAIGGRSEGCSVRFLENLLSERPEIPLLLVLGDCYDPAISIAISQVKSKAKALKHPNAQMALEQIAPAVIHALAAMDGESEFNNPQYQLELAALTAELHVQYVMERLLIDSDLVIDRVAMGNLEVQGAVVQADGSLRMLTGPDVHRLIGQKARVERHRRKGVGLGRFRTKARQFVYTPRA